MNKESNSSKKRSTFVGESKLFNTKILQEKNYE